MVTNDLEQANRELIESVNREAEHSGEPQRSCFFGLFADVASNNGDCVDLEYAPVHKEGSRGYQIDGFAVDADRGEAYLAICDFDPSGEVQPLNQGDVDSLFGRVERFFQNSVSPDFINSLEEASPAFEAAYPLYSNQKKIRRIRVIIFSNSRLAVRSKKVETKAIGGKTFTYSVLDLNRYVDIENAQGGHEPIEIDIAELNGSPLPCIEAHTEKGSYRAYLAAVPGELLCEIYGRYGARLLEQNVRSFLQARGKVNQGIITTIMKEPEMFFAYNNGITATASGVEFASNTHTGGGGISSLRDFQIVNGGQTTASLLYAKDHPLEDAVPGFLSKIYVQMKLSIIESDKVDKVVPKISRYANTQNKVSESDLFSNHPFHLEMEKISRRLSAPPRPGSMATSKWFYERARGQYRNESAYGTASEKRRFESDFPKEQVIEKTDLAKFELTFLCQPEIVCRGAQKCFSEFANLVDKEWSETHDSFNESYFKDAVSKAIVFKWTDHLIGTSDWYKSDRGYKSQILAYTIAWLVNHVQSKLNSEIDLERVWSSQDVPEEIREAISEIAPRVADAIKAAPPEIRNIGEYCKRQVCWAAVRNLDIELSPELAQVTIEKSQVLQRERDARQVHKMDREFEFDELILKLAGNTGGLAEFSRRHGCLSPLSSAALSKIERGNLRLSGSDKNSLKNLFRQVRERGYEIGG